MHSVVLSALRLSLARSYLCVFAASRENKWGSRKAANGRRGVSLRTTKLREKERVGRKIKRISAAGFVTFRMALFSGADPSSIRTLNANAHASGPREKLERETFVFPLGSVTSLRDLT
jgi:hypothetical protein